MVKSNPLESRSEPPIESFEKCRLQSVSIQGGVRAIKRTTAANEIEIEVEHSSLVITVDGSSRTFSLCGVRRIRAIGDVAVTDDHGADDVMKQ